MKILFVRHGQASYGTADYDRLSPLGHKQAGLLGKYLHQEYGVIDEVHVGLLQRQQHTLDYIESAFREEEIILPERNNTTSLNEFHGPRILTRIMPELLERDEHVKSLSQAMSEAPESFLEYSLKIFAHAMEEWADGNLHDLQPPEYDDWATFHTRSEMWLNGLVGNGKEKQGKTILAVTSGGTISSMVGITKKLEDPRKIVRHVVPILNASITEIEVNGNGKEINLFNGVSYLSDEMKTYV